MDARDLRLLEADEASERLLDAQADLDWAETDDEREAAAEALQTARAALLAATS